MVDEIMGVVKISRGQACSHFALFSIPGAAIITKVLSRTAFVGCPHEPLGVGTVNGLVSEVAAISINIRLRTITAMTGNIGLKCIRSGEISGENRLLRVHFVVVVVADFDPVLQIKGSKRESPTKCTGKVRLVIGLCTHEFTSLNLVVTLHQHDQRP